MTRRRSARPSVSLTTRRPGGLAKYNPDKGLKSIAVAEAAEKHFARAKDASKLYAAIEAKLTAQAEFVAWWDAQEKQQGARGEPGPGRGRREKRRRRSATPFQAGKNGIPDRYIIERWRQKLAGDRFDSALEKARDRCLRMIEMQATGVHVSHNSGELEWYTPGNFIEAAREVLGDIDLDPASSDAANRVVKAAQIFTLTQSGLDQPWHGRVWMNPPYALGVVDQFCEKLAAEFESGRVTAAVVIVNNATETGWFHALASVAAGVCLLKGRVRYWTPRRDSKTPLQGQAILYLGPHLQRFEDAFRSFGVVLVRPEVPA